MKLRLIQAHTGDCIDNLYNYGTGNMGSTRQQNGCKHARRSVHDIDQELRGAGAMESSREPKLRGAGAAGSWSVEHRSYQERELRGAGATGSWSDEEQRRAEATGSWSYGELE
jgi:hypothetical protein